jgi:hypothetical protein
VLHGKEGALPLALAERAALVTGAQWMDVEWEGWWEWEEWWERGGREVKRPCREEREGGRRGERAPLESR